MIKDIHPRTPVASLDRNGFASESNRTFPLDTVAAVVGMSRSFVERALGRSPEVPLAGVFKLLDLDAFAETFVPRSKIPAFLIRHASNTAEMKPSLAQDEDHHLYRGNSINLIPRLASHTVQCVVTSTPYWGTRVYNEHFVHRWADGEECAFGNEQTPEGFVRHSVEIMFYLKPAIRLSGSVWWNLMDTYNTRTQIRANASETLNAMRGNDARGWRDHSCRRYSAGHSYLKDGEQCHIPSQVANRAAKIGYFVKSIVSWKKNGSLPETVASRVTRELEYIIHLSIRRAPLFNKKAFLTLSESIGGRNKKYEAEKLTDVWHFSTASGLDGHGAQFPVALPGRCIALTSQEQDLVLDPFVGSGTTSIAAVLLGRRSIGFDVADTYLTAAARRLQEAQEHEGSLHAKRPTRGRPQHRQANLL